MGSEGRQRGRGNRRTGWLVVAVAAGLFLASRAAARAGVDHFATWAYHWSWYPFLLAVDGLLAATSGRFALLSRPRFALSLWLWSAPIWFFFELLNLRLANWFYVGVPPDAAERWAGYLLAFATVLPAVWLPLAALDRAGLARGLEGPGFRVGRRVLRGVAGTGVLFLALPLWHPELFYPLVWGAPALLLAPWNHARDPETSLLGELGSGRYGRLVRLLTAGLSAGVAWEALNWFAGGRWIYTVPGLEEVKLFEMPVAGFLGFPAFAVECAVMYRALVNAGIALPEEGGDARRDRSGTGEVPGLRAGRVAVAGPVALAFSLAVAAGVDRWTVASTEPSLEALPAVDGAAVERIRSAGVAGPAGLARADSATLSRWTGVEPGRAGAWIRGASLAGLRGLGGAGARALWGGGIRSVCDLARAEESEVTRLLRTAGVLGPAHGAGRRARVWIRAARAACPGAGPSGGPSPARGGTAERGPAVAPGGPGREHAPADGTVTGRHVPAEEGPWTKS